MASAPVPGAARRIEFAGDDPLPAEPRIPGAHNRENAAAATAAARAAGIGDGAIAEALRTFPGVEHRIEELATIAGVRYVNDSKATNVAAALRALASFPGRAAARDPRRPRQGRELRAARRRRSQPDDRAYLIGEAAGGDRGRARRRRRPVRARGRPRDGGRCAPRRAAAEGDVVLLSPACASFDQFTSYEQRGQEFGKLVQKLQG